MRERRSNLHVAMSYLSNKIYCGSVGKDGRTWLSNQTDVTGEACAAVALHALARDGSVIVTENGKPKYEINVKELSDA